MNIVNKDYFLRLSDYIAEDGRVKSKHEYIRDMKIFCKIMTHAVERLEKRNTNLVNKLKRIKDS